MISFDMILIYYEIKMLDSDFWNELTVFRTKKFGSLKDLNNVIPEADLVPKFQPNHLFSCTEFQKVCKKIKNRGANNWNLLFIIDLRINFSPGQPLYWRLCRGGCVCLYVLHFKNSQQNLYWG